MIWTSLHVTWKIFAVRWEGHSQRDAMLTFVSVWVQDMLPSWEVVLKGSPMRPHFASIFERSHIGWRQLIVHQCQRPRSNVLQQPGWGGKNTGGGFIRENGSKPSTHKKLNTVGGSISHSGLQAWSLFLVPPKPTVTCRSYAMFRTYSLFDGYITALAWNAWNRCPDSCQSGHAASLFLSIFSVSSAKEFMVYFRECPI